jgi:hypothetical protein
MLVVCKKYKAVVSDWFLNLFFIDCLAIESLMLRVSVIDFVSTHVLTFVIKPAFFPMRYETIPKL